MEDAGLVVVADVPADVDGEVVDTDEDVDVDVVDDVVDVDVVDVEDVVDEVDTVDLSETETMGFNPFTSIVDYSRQRK